MTPLEIVAVLLAGTAAGTINSVVGSGTLITFPTLLALGMPPVLANMSNNVGLVPGAVAGAFGYRRELGGQKKRLIRLGIASILGSFVGAAALLLLPAAVFDGVVPVLIGLGCVLVLLQPRISRAAAARAEAKGKVRPEHGSLWVWVMVLLCGVYGGYFGAAQGVLLVAVLGVGLSQSMQRNNAAKNVLASLNNGVAALVFITVTDVDWLIAGLIAVGSTIGGLLGASVGRRLPPIALRVVIVTVGVAAITMFVVRS